MIWRARAERAWPIVLIGALLAALPAAGICRAQAPAEEDAAEASATAWLGLVDAGRYGASWDESASLFKGAVQRDHWERTMSGVRAPLGAVARRRVKSRARHEKLPGAPDGRYVVIQFETSFENKKEAVETVTPMLDGARGWRVSGYYIQ